MAKSLRRLVFGVGTNDADYHISQCPYYRRWHSMLRRCYSEYCQRRYPSYSGCTVCVEWLTFSVFKVWMTKQDWDGKHLDKDILVTGNKEYGPETCVFVSPELNTLLTDHFSARGGTSSRCFFP